MGSLSWFSSPSRPGEPPHHQARMNLPALLLITLALLTSPSLQLREGKSAVRYLGDTFLLPDGCPSDNPLVQRGRDTLCSTDRLPNGRSLTIPAFSNICSAVCQDVSLEGMRICPYEGQVLTSDFLRFSEV